jgi:hypothetical protein
MFTRQKLLNLVTLVRHYKSELIIVQRRNIQDRTQNFRKE